MEQYLIEQYFTNKRSIVSLAEELKTYPNKIRRILKKAGKTLRDKSEAQKQALKSGRHKHPTKDTERSDATKKAIAKSVHDTWEKLDQKDKDKFKAKSRANWNKIDPLKKEQMVKKAHAAIRKAAKEGSRMERFILEKLEGEGYAVEWHLDNLVPNENLTVDLFLKDHYTVIEIDGTSHSEPIWGMDSFHQTKRADLDKNGLLISRGYNLIRLKCLKKNLSNIYMEERFDKLMLAINQIQNKQGKLIVVEDKDNDRN